MIHAITHKKSRIYQRYLGRRDPDEKRVSAEDEITSLIMSPLAFMTSEAIGVFWTSLLENRFRDLDFPTAPVSSAKMHFWPRGSVEPDLFVELEWESRELRCLLVEFKWRSPLSGPDQLHKQWEEFLSDRERKNAYHIFIAPEVSEGNRALGRRDVWGGRLLLFSWTDVLARLQGLSKPEAKLLGACASEVISLFHLLNISPFLGFEYMNCQQETCSESPVFWRAIGGFSNMLAPLSRTPGANAEQSVFWRSNE